jgi:hypothetical protein
VVLGGERGGDFGGAGRDDGEGEPCGGVASGDGVGACFVGVPEGGGPVGEGAVGVEVIGGGFEVERADYMSIVSFLSSFLLFFPFLFFFFFLFSEPEGYFGDWRPENSQREARGEKKVKKGGLTRK